MTFATYFNPGVSLQGGSGSGSGTASLPITGNGATVTASTPLIDGTQTWNNAATTFTAFKINATDTASNAASLLMDLQVGGASVFFHRKSGAAYGPLGTAAAVSYGATANVGTGLFFPSATNLGFSVNGTSQFNISTTSLSVPSTSIFGFSVGAIGTAVDTILTRRGVANLRFGAADAAAPVAQKLSVQSVVAGTSNTAGGDLTITGSQSTGSGVGGSIIFQTAAANSGGGATVQNTLANAMVIDSVKTVRLGTGYTVATLPAAGTAGRRTYVTDATVPTFLGTLTGGGAVVCPVFDNGTAWVSA
jgi:hypothetical protein